MFDKILFIFVKQPENILFGKDDYMKIADFGLITETNEEERYTVGVGTPLYMAPEVVKSSRYSNKADIFSLGLIISHFFTPFSNKHERCEAIEKMRKNEFPEELNKYKHVSIYVLRTLCFFVLKNFGSICFRWIW